MTYNPPPRAEYDFTNLPPAPDQNAEPDLLLEIHERICYLTDLIESVLKLEYLLNPERK